MRARVDLDPGVTDGIKVPQVVEVLTRLGVEAAKEIRNVATIDCEGCERVAHAGGWVGRRKETIVGVERGNEEPSVVVLHIGRGREAAKVQHNRDGDDRIIQGYVRQRRGRGKKTSLKRKREREGEM